MKKPIQKTNLSSLAPLLLFTVFTACILLVLLTGADVYQKFTQRDQFSYHRRTTSQYIATRVRQSDAKGMYFIGNFDDTTPQEEGDTFFYCENLGGRLYYTRIYCHEGRLCELFAAADSEFVPGDGQPILEVGDLHFYWEDGLLRVEITHADGTEETLRLHLRCKEEGLYEP